jgi:hypothetical protein
LIAISTTTTAVAIEVTTPMVRSAAVVGSHPRGGSSTTMTKPIQQVTETSARKPAAIPRALGRPSSVDVLTGARYAD